MLDENNLKTYDALAKKEGWETALKRIDTNGILESVPVVYAEGRTYALAHPYEISLKLYRDHEDPDIKFKHMKKVHDWLWPDQVETWHSWTERRFRAHCEGYAYITMAGGAGVGKSVDAAKIGYIFYESDPFNNACVVASTTLDSLESRIWGYVVKYATSTVMNTPGIIRSGKPPKIIQPGQKDRIHGMFAVAIRQGEEERVLSTLIGRHPNKRILIILDEATDMNVAVTSAFPNLSKGVEFFQAWAIGNSSSRNDLHGALSTPKAGWETVEYDRNDSWETKYDNGICLYFNPYKSPAILEKDPGKKAALSKFLVTEESLEKDEDFYGKGSSAYYRFVLGFWRAKDLDDVIITEQFLTENEVYKYAEWSGFHPLYTVAGLDPAFQAGGSNCVLQFAIVGQTSSGLMALDYRGEEYIHRIEVALDYDGSAERQIAEQVIVLLRRYRCPLTRLAIDCTGVGRALGELIKVLSREEGEPLRFVSTRPGLKKGKTDPHIIVTNPPELWFSFREFVQSGQIRGLSRKAIFQITNRLLERKGVSNKLYLETKTEYKARMAAVNPREAHSPDDADAAMLALQAAIYAFGIRPGQVKELPTEAQGKRPLWEEKMAVVTQERMAERERQRSQFRPKLLPNFSQTVEESFGGD